MMHRLLPTQAVRSVIDLDLSELRAMGKRVLIFDLDGTLCRRGTKNLNRGISQYLTSVQEAGFQVGILTNRRHNATDPIVQKLAETLPVVARAGKPLHRGFIQALKSLNAAPEEAVVIGDKRWTDILGANRMGIHSIQVSSHLRVE